MVFFWSNSFKGINPALLMTIAVVDFRLSSTYHVLIRPLFEL